MTRQIYQIKGNELHLHIENHAGQQAAFQSKKRFIFILAGTQGGKTSFGPWWLWHEIQRTWEDGEDNDYLVVTPTYTLFDKKLLPEMQKVFREILGIGRWHASKKIMELCDMNTRIFASDLGKKMCGRIMFVSATAGGKQVGVKDLEASTAKAAWLDECGMDEFPQVAWEAIQRRLSLATKKGHGRALGTTTIYNFDWLYHMVYIPWTQGDPDFEIIQFDSKDNPSFPVEEYERAKKYLPPWKFDMLYRGRFTRPAGMIYQDYDEAVHVCDPFVIPIHWPQYVGIDPGAVNTAVVWVAMNPDTKEFYLWKESLEGNITSEEHAKRLLDTASRFRGVRITYTGGAPSEKQFRMDMQDHGVPVQEPPFGEVEAGINRVTARLRGGKFKIFRTCPMTRAQMREYARELDVTGQPMDKIKDKEKYHALDALRYCVSRMPTEYAVTVPLDYARGRKINIPTIKV